MMEETGHVEELLSAVDFPVVLVSDVGRVIFSNAAAGRILAPGKGIEVGAAAEKVLGIEPGALERLAERAGRTDEWLAVPVRKAGLSERFRVRARRVNWEGRRALVVVLDRVDRWHQHCTDALAGLPVMFFETDAEGRLVDGLQQVGAALGMDAAAIERAGLRDLVHEDDRVRFDEVWRRLAAGESVRGQEIILEDGRKRRRFFWFSLFPLRDNSGGLIGVRGLAGDMAVQKGLAYALEAAEERFNVLFRESSDPILILAMDGDILSVNPAFERLAGIRSDELFCGEKGWKDFVWGEDLERVMGALQACAAAGGGEKPVEYRMKSASGGLLWLEQSHSILHDEHGNARGIMAVARDVTRRKERELLLRADAQRMEQRHARVQELIGRLTSFFRRTSDLPEELGEYLAGVCDLLFEMYRPLMVCIAVPGMSRSYYQAGVHLAREQLESGGSPKLCTLAARLVKDGSLYFSAQDGDGAGEFAHDPAVEALGIRTVLAAPLRDGTGLVRGALALFDTRRREFDHLEVELLTIAALQVAARLRAAEQEDIRRELEEHLRQAQKMEAVGLLAGGIAHDFNNILSGILGFASFLRSKSDPASDEHRYLGLIEQSATQASELTRRLLSFSRRTHFVKQSVSLNEVVGEVTDILRHSVSKGITIELDLDDDLPPVLGDPAQLNQVVMNLCINAVEAMMPEGGTLRVVTEARELNEREQNILGGARSGEFVCLTVADTGKGMDPEVQSHIFDPFFTTKSGSGGTGLGLSIVYGIVNNHGGDITVTSREGEGTEIRVFLPVHLEAVAAERGEKGGRVRGSETILVVDDEAIVRQMVGEILQAHGYCVLRAASGSEALEIVRKEQGNVDLVLLDMVMPEHDGQATFDDLQQERPGLAVLLTTGYAQGEECNRLIEKGALGLVRKPYRSYELLRAVRDALDTGAGEAKSS